MGKKNLKFMLFFILSINILFASTINRLKWKRGDSFSSYLKDNGVNINIFNIVSADDLKFLSEIRAGVTFYELLDSSGKLEQVLIPIGEKTQIFLGKVRATGKYTFDIISIIYDDKEYGATVSIDSNPYIDVKNTLHNSKLANKVSQALKAVNTKKLKKGDKLSFIYEQKTRMGLPYDIPDVKIEMLETKGKKQFIYIDEDGYGYVSDKTSQAYTVKGRKKITFTKRVAIKRGGIRFGMPLRHIRITSPFSYRRWHPILHIYRPHHGTDFGARRGTPLLAVNNGRVTYAGWMRGYGRVVKIRHAGGYESLYAHQSRMRVHVGQHVKKGQIIGYVGSSGRSTGPHLHFGLAKNGRWVNPMKVLGKKYVGRASRSVLKKFTKYKDTTTTKYRTISIKNAGSNREKLLKYLKSGKKPFIWSAFKGMSMNIEDVPYD